MPESIANLVKVQQNAIHQLMQDILAMRKDMTTISEMCNKNLSLIVELKAEIDVLKEQLLNAARKK